MSETGAVKSLATGLVNPSIDILKFWQGVVEIAIRGTVLVLTLIVIIAGSACQSALSSLGDLNGSSLDESTRSACGWLIFVGVIALIYEALFIVLRFLNIGILNNHILWVLLIDAIVHGVIAGSIFAGTIACATYAGDWGALPDAGVFQSGVDRVTSSTGAVAAFGFFTLIADIGLLVYILLGALFFKWNPTLAKYSAGSAASASSS